MGKILLFLFFLGVVLVLPGPFFQRILYFLIGFVSLIRWGNHVVSKSLSVQVDTVRSKGFSGDDLSLTLKVSNPTCFPVFWCTVRQSFPEGIGGFCERWILSLNPRESKDIKVDFRGQRRGIFEIPDTKVVLGDPWGLQEMTDNFKFAHEIIIYPSISPLLGQWLQRHLPLGRYKITFGLHEDPARLRGCREYAPSDSMKRIHWPSSAHTGRLQAKDWETTLNAEIGIFLNLAEENYPTAYWYYLMELGIECAASLTVYLHNKGEKIGFYSNGMMENTSETGLFCLNPKTGKQQEEKVLTYLAGAGVAKHQDPLELFEKAAQMTAGSSLIFITPIISQSMVEKTNSLRRTGYHPLFLWLYSKNAEAPRTELKALKVPVMTVERERETDAIRFA